MCDGVQIGLAGRAEVGALGKVLPSLPVPAPLTPLRDDHAWHFPNDAGHPVHVRLRAWPVKDRGGHLVIGTDLMLGGLINMAESFHRAVVAEFGERWRWCGTSRPGR
ncbi:hypothetical protein AB0F13_23780 [Streptomyces sp. NPDC026206]|uniref:hypothetical protein n=1 Tax=Streptomyces sp. NPDC026206 TaxID=3157089 RepID=UPI0033E9E4F2